MTQVDNNWKTPLGYYERAIEELKRSREELQEYQKNVADSVHNLQSEIQELKSKLQTTQEQLEATTKTAADLETNLFETQKIALNYQNELNNLKEIMNEEPKANTQVIAELAYIKQQLALLPTQDKQSDSQTEIILQCLSDLKLKISQLTTELTLVSATSGIDYRKLQELLVEQKWQEADQETYSILLKIAEREEHGWLDNGDIKKLPRHDLNIINKLWVQHSQEKFGFSIQKLIFQITKDNNFFYRVGWLTNIKNNEWVKYEEYKFSLDAHKGHLPSTSRLVGLGLRNPNEIIHRVRILLTRL